MFCIQEELLAKFAILVVDLKPNDVRGLWCIWVEQTPQLDLSYYPIT